MNHSKAKALKHLLDVPLRVSVELGRSRLPIQDILGLQPGSLVALGTLAGEPLDVRVNGKLIARGECVVVNERYAVRITEVIDGAVADELMDRSA